MTVEFPCPFCFLPANYYTCNDMAQLSVLIRAHNSTSTICTIHKCVGQSKTPHPTLHLVRNRAFASYPMIVDQLRSWVLVKFTSGMFDC